MLGCNSRLEPPQVLDYMLPRARLAPGAAGPNRP